MIDQPGYYDLSMAEYLGDPAPEAALSSKLFDAILKESPADAKVLHPRIGTAKPDASPRADIGSAVHALVNGGYPVVYGDYKDFRTDKAKAWRDEARASMQIPILLESRLQVEIAAGAAKRTLEKFGPGKFEQTMLFQIPTELGPVWARCRTDYTNAELDIDLVTSDNPNPVHWMKHVAPNGKKQQAGLRSLGHEILGQPRKMVWLVQKLTHPYTNSLIGMSPAMMAMQQARAKHSAKIWRKCLNEQKWPGYGDEIYWAEPSPWEANELAQETGVIL